MILDNARIHHEMLMRLFLTKVKDIGINVNVLASI